jgi:predicted HicB family RNase H-like nuclease
MSNLLNYKGYYGNVEYSSEDDCFFGKLIGINDLVTFEGKSTDELKTAFHEAVDDYLLMCERHGKPPEKAYKGSFNVRIQPELHRQAALMAAARGMSLNAFVEEVIRHNLTQE